MSTRADRAKKRNRRRCRNCGQFGAHLVPPTSGSPSMYTCERNEDLVRKFHLTPAPVEPTDG